MISPAEFFTLLEQCCDGKTYLMIGEICAREGQCYDTQRPMGALYWFSLPYRLGLDGNSLVMAHLLLLLLSAFLALRWIQSDPVSVVRSRACAWLVALACAAIHLVFMYPLLRVAFSDIPAAALALLAGWILLSAGREGHSAGALFIAGLCLGLAAWVRAFYLYPVLLGLGSWFACGLWRNSLRPRHYFLLAALIPIAVQYAATYDYSKRISYIEPAMLEQAMEIHLDDPAVGYEVILHPKKYLRWNSSCGDISGQVTAVKNIDVHSLACLIKGRLYFYLGSYSADIYPVFDSFESYWGNNPLPLPATELQYVVRDSRMEGFSAQGIRCWSLIYLSMNVAVFAFAGWMMWRKRDLSHPATLFVAVMLLVMAEALLIVPEQRFIIAPMIVAWTACLKFTLSRMGHAACKLA